MELIHRRWSEDSPPPAARSRPASTGGVWASTPALSGCHDAAPRRAGPGLTSDVDRAIVGTPGKWPGRAGGEVPTSGAVERGARSFDEEGTVLVRQSLYAGLLTG